MKITRREALRQCLVISVGAALIPSCLQEKSKPLLALKHVNLSGADQELIAELSETIIPKTDTPGAKETGTHLFLMKMLDDCSTKEEQQQFVKGLNEFDKLAKKKFDNSFVKCTPAQRESLIKDIINKKDASADVAAFYETMKKQTVQGYMSSQFYLTNVRVYKLVPGKFTGCIPVTSLDKNAVLI